MKLTDHFKLIEFTRSSTATARHIDNTPSEQVIKNLKNLCTQVLEPLRTYANQSSPSKGDNGSYANQSSPSKGDKKVSVPIIIGSGYRCPALNKAVGGVTNSQHQTGEACDITIPDEATGKRWFRWMSDNLPFDQLIWEKSTPSSTHHWIHVSLKSNGRQRQQVITNLIKNK